MSTPLVRQVRLAFIWVETTLDLVREPVPAAPLAFLGRDASYVPRFDNLQKGVTDPDGLTLPWPKPAGQRFWQFYLNHRPGDVGGGKAWGALVPFRLKLDVSVSAPWLPGRVTTEGFFYPHGHGLIVTFQLEPSPAISLEATVELARDLRKRKKLAVVWSPTRSEELILDGLADAALAMLRERALGKGRPAGAVASVPFSVVTFVGVGDVDPTVAPPDSGEIHRALEMVTGWHGGPLGTVPPLKDNVLDPEKPLEVVYAKKRGRAVWFPYYATTSGVQTLGCYHRNLVFASLQVESLARLAVESLLQGFLSDTHRDLARYAGGLLGRLYGGDEKTYRSASCRVQLEQNAWLDPTDEIRVKFPSMGKLQRV
jgi:hypothetical protein